MQVHEQHQHKFWLVLSSWTECYCGSILKESNNDVLNLLQDLSVVKYTRILNKWYKKGIWYQEVFVQGCYSQDSCRQVFCEILLRSNQTAWQDSHGWCQRLWWFQSEIVVLHALTQQRGPLQRQLFHLQAFPTSYTIYDKECLSN